MVHFLLVNIALTYINLPKVLSENTCGLIGGCSSNGRALALHVRGSGIDARILHKTFNYFFYLGGESPVNVENQFYS